MASHFKSILLTESFSDVNYTIRILKMSDSYLIYMGESNGERLNGISVGVKDHFAGGNDVRTTSILNPMSEDGSEKLAHQLTITLQKTVFVSLNIPNDAMLLASLKRSLFGEIKKNEEFFK